MNSIHINSSQETPDTCIEFLKKLWEKGPEFLRNNEIDIRYLEKVLDFPEAKDYAEYLKVIIESDQLRDDSLA